VTTQVFPAAPRARRFAAWRGYAGIQVRVSMAYRTDYLFNLVGLLVQVFLLTVVWRSVYAGRGTVSGVNLSTQLAYTTFGSVQYWLFTPWSFSVIPDRVRTGRIAVDLVRPLPFLGQVTAAQTGITAGMAPFAILALPVVVLIGGAAAPPSVGAGLGYVLSLVLAYGISTLVASTVGMAAFWTTEVTGFFMLYRMVGQFFSGALVPLWFMPGWLSATAHALPFQAMNYTSLAIYLGRDRGDRLILDLLVQLGWLVLAALVLRLVWSRALRRVISQGG
jgi:ABC-type uncharacterized transport system permease subunit